MAGENNADNAPPEGTPLEGEGGQPEGSAPPAEGSPQLTQEELVKTVADTVTHNLQSFMGRRDKALIDGITNNFDGIVEKKLSAYTHNLPNAGANNMDNIEFDYENPMAAVEQAAENTFKRLRQQETTEAAQFQEDVLNGIGQYMDNNPMFKDQEFGKRVIEHAMRNIGNANRSVDGRTAGQMLVQDTTLNLIAEEKAGSNALSGRPAPTGSPGSVGPPPAGEPPREPQMPKLSEHAQKLVDHYGYSTEEVIKILGE